MRIKTLLQASGELACGALLAEALDLPRSSARSICRQPPRRLRPSSEILGHAGQVAAIVRGRYAGRPRFRFHGSAEAICRQVVDRCWNGRFFATSLGHYSDVWTRDLGLCSEALIRLGYRDELKLTLAFTLDAYERAGRVTTVVRRTGYGQDIYGEPADAFPLLLRSLALVGDRELTERHRPFLQTAARDYLLDLGVHAKEGFKDTVVRGFSTYEVVMLDVVLKAAGDLDIPVPRLDARLLPQRMLRSFWRRTHFAPTRAGNGSHFSADATILPFMLTSTTTGRMISAALAEIRHRRLDDPFPLVFSDPPHCEEARLLPRLLAPGYQADTIWSIFGALTILLARRARETAVAERYARAYAHGIEEAGTFYELFTRDGRPYQSWCYRSCEGMLWAALYLDAVTAKV
jgi:hypothetical protein